jgi:DNA-binding transcriptional LysR family regulator
MLEEAQAILGRVEVAEVTARLLASGTKAILRVGYTTISGHALVPDITREFRRTNPQVRLELTYMTSPVQRDRILQDEIDLGFLDGHFQSSEIETLPVARHRLMALMPPEHPLAAKASITVEELAGEKLVMGTDFEWPTFRRIVVNMFQQSGHVMSVAQEASSLTGILGLVTAGVGVTVFTGMPRFCGRDAIVARPIVTDTMVETHLAWRRKGMSDAMRRFADTSKRVSEHYM